MKMKNIKFLQKVFMVSTVVLVLAGCKDDFTAPPAPSGTPLATVASTNDNFNILTAALKKTALYNSLNNNNSGYFTVFSPSDAAFITYFKNFNPALVTEADVIAFVNALPPTAAPGQASIAVLAGVLNYHTMGSSLTSDKITGNQVFTTLNGARLSISKTGATVVLNANSAANGATVTAVDVLASNGVIHTIDRVMAPVTNANVLSTIGKSASTPTTGITISYATNPPTLAGATTVGTADNYELMGVAIRRTGVAASIGITPIVLPNSAPLPDFTIFAPTDAALQAYLGIAVGTGTEGAAQTAINALDQTTLSNLLKYHIVAGRILSTDLSNGQVVTTLAGTTFTVNINGSTITLVDGNTGNVDPVVGPANTLTNSGIVHTLNAVLLPN